MCARLEADLDAGFVDLVRAYEGVVLTVAARACSSPQAEAQDIAAEAFLRAYRALRDYPPERIAQLRLRPWLVTIALNVGRNARRQAARRPLTTTLGDVDGPGGPNVRTATDEPPPEGGDGLRKLVDGLPPVQRVAVVLRHVVGLSNAEIAHALGCPEGTARSHVSRGMSSLRRRWRATEEGGT